MSGKKLGIIIPYRDRLEHLTALLPKLSYCLTNAWPRIDHKIVVVEQQEGELFNRGHLKNVGSIYCEDCDYFCFHDVDMIPDEKANNYSYGDGATLLATKVKQFNYTKPYNNYLGGVVLIDKLSFKTINGYSNAYWYWGVEDDDFYERCLIKNVAISNRNNCRFDSFEHDRDQSKRMHNVNILKQFLRSPILFDANGLNSLNYEVLEETNVVLENINYKHVKISIKGNKYHP